MSVDRYAEAASGWDASASRVYGPLAVELVARSPHRLAGRLVLDAGAGTGCGTVALQAVRARTLGVDLSVAMLRRRRGQRPPSVAGDVTRLPLATGSVDDAIAAFVLNHLARPDAAAAELARVARPGGAVLATVFANTSSSAARDRVDEVALRHGFVVPQWYIDLKTGNAAAVGTPGGLAAAARAGGLRRVQVEQVAVDVGVHDAVDLVDYRLSQAQYAPWVGALSVRQRQDLRAAALDAVGPVMEPYRPVVLFLSCLV